MLERDSSHAHNNLEYLVSGPLPHPTEIEAPCECLVIISSLLMLYCRELPNPQSGHMIAFLNGLLLGKL